MLRLLTHHHLVSLESAFHYLSSGPEGSICTPKYVPLSTIDNFNLLITQWKLRQIIIK